MGIFKKSLDEYVIDVLKNKSEKSDYIYCICEAHALDLIARTIAKSELQVFRYDKKEKKITEKKDEVYYRFNIKANPNENAFSLKRRLALKLIIEGKSLIIFNKEGKQKVNYMYLVNTFDANNLIMKPKKFTNITLEDYEGNEIKLDKSYYNNSGECLYFTYDNSNLYNQIQTYKEHSINMLKVIEKAYKSANVNKWRLKNPGGQAKLIDAETKEEIDYTKYKKKITEGLLDDEEKIILLSEIFDLYKLNENDKKDIGDYLKQIEDIGKKVAMSFNIPVDLFFGTKTEKSTANTDFLTFCIDPILRSIEETLNSEIVDEKDFIKGEYVMFNRLAIEILDLTNLGKSLEKLTSIGFSFNQLCKILNIPEIDEQWANEHHITKNFSNTKGGEEDGE